MGTTVFEIICFEDVGSPFPPKKEFLKNYFLSQEA